MGPGEAAFSAGTPHAELAELVLASYPLPAVALGNAGGPVLRNAGVVERPSGSERPTDRGSAARAPPKREAAEAQHDHGQQADEGEHRRILSWRPSLRDGKLAMANSPTAARDRTE